MKKISTLILALLGTFGAVQAQSVKWYYGDKALQAGATVEIMADETGYADTNEPEKLVVRNETGNPVAISVTVRKQDPSDAQLTWCGITQVCMPMTSRSETRTNTVEADGKLDMNLDAMFNFEEYGTYKTTATLTAEGESQVINIHFIYSEDAGVHSALAGSLAYAGGVLTYSFDTPATRQLSVCNVAGQTVKTETLGLSGSTSLAGLPAGIYIARIVAGGKTVATRKCLVK